MTPPETREETWPYLTRDLTGVGGVIKKFDEDFLVAEQPLYLPCGKGTHVYFTIEKRGLPTLAAVRQIARALGRQPREIGYAGLKDAHAVTRQMLSLEHVQPARIEAIALAKIKVLTISRHTNKLKLGHLAGNRFKIRIRDMANSSLSAARAVLEVLNHRGVPNYFGPQRFGLRGDNALIGRAVLCDDYDEAIALMLGRPGPMDRGQPRRARELFDAGDLSASAAAWPRGTFDQQAQVCRALIRHQGDAQKAWRAVDHTLRKFYVSAFQSDLFNRVLAARIDTLDHLEAGDIAWKHRNGACFRVEDAAVEQPRCDEFEISPTGPLFGRRMTEASGHPGQREADILARCGMERGQSGKPEPQASACAKSNKTEPPASARAKSSKTALPHSVRANDSVQRESLPSPEPQASACAKSNRAESMASSDPNASSASTAGNTVLLECFARMRTQDGTRLDGARRPLRVPLRDMEIGEGNDERGHYLGLTFTLPPGAYATNVIREITKHSP